MSLENIKKYKSNIEKKKKKVIKLEKQQHNKTQHVVSSFKIKNHIKLSNKNLRKTRKIK